MHFTVSRYCIFLMFVCFTFSGINTNAQWLTYKNLAAKDGLLSPEMHILIQDSKGYVWIGTKKGLCRWDSKNFEYFTIEDGLPNNEVLFLYEDAKGRIWISCFSQELCYFYNGHIYNRKNTPLLDNIKSRQGSHMVEKNNELYYVAVNDKLTKIDLATGKVAVVNDELLPSVYLLNIKNKIWAVQDERDKTIFSKGQGRSLVLSEDTSYYLPYYHFPDFPNTDIVAAADLKNKQYYFQHGFDAPFYTGKYNNDDFQIAIYNRGKVLEVYTDYILQKKNGYRIKINNPTNRPQINGIKGRLFMRTADGLLFCTQVPLLEYEQHPDIDNNVQLLFKYKGEMYLINNSYQIVNVNRQQVTYRLKSGTINLYNLIEVKGRFYMTTSFNVFSFSDPHEVKGLSGDRYFMNYKYISPARMSDWFFTANGIRYGISVTNFAKGLSDTLMISKHTSVYSVYEDSRSRLWYSTTNKVYYTSEYYNGVKNSREFVLDRESPLFCRSVQEDPKGNIFFTTNGGVFVYDGRNRYRIDRSNLLSDNECNKVVIDTVHSSFWVATMHGLNQIGYWQEGDSLKFKMLSKFFSTDGLRSDNINDLLLDSNKLYIGTDAGVNILDDVTYRPDTMRIPVFTRLKAVNSAASKAYDTLETISLRHDQNNLTIGFSALYFLRRDRLKVKAYLYRNSSLISQNEITEDKIDYYSLNDGDYELVLYAYDQDYRYNNGRSVPFRFTINPPYYKTWWFISGTSLLIIVITTSLLVWRQSLKRKRALQEAELQARLNESTLKSLQSQMNPHFVFNSLNTIQSFITEKNEEGAMDYLSDFSVLMREMLEQSVHTFISLENEIRFLQQYVRLEMTRYKDSFDIEWDIRLGEEDLTDIYIPTMLIQPILENAVKHGVSTLNEEKGHIEAIFTLVNEHLLQVVVKDNGRPSTGKSFKGNSIAVKTIRDRLSIYTKNKIKGSYTLEVTETGATAIITIPI